MIISTRTEKDGHKDVKQNWKQKTYGERVRNSKFLLNEFEPIDYQSKASRYRKGLTYFENRATTNKKQYTLKHGKEEDTSRKKAHNPTKKNRERNKEKT